ncbi:MAG: chemotaxis protein CheW, partial [Nitrospirota bacterium]|nr:chemotaxis protein CheW [Nitrospirota bacterium]
VNIVVLKAEGQRFGLVVDEINDMEEIVVKPLSKQLKGVPVFAGATIMGDGRVALILDVLGLANRAEMTIQQSEGARIDSLDKGHDSKGHREMLLIVKVGESGQVAIPLKMVARLEEIQPSSLEEASGKKVIQYRGEILPIIRLSQVLCPTGSSDGDMTEALQMVVISHGQRRIGLIVKRIVDIVDEFLQGKHVSIKPEILCSAVIQERVTDVLDVQQLILDYAGLSAEEPVEELIGV